MVLRERRGVRIVDPILAEWLRRRYQAVKYRQREGTSHRDLLRLAHPGAAVTAGNPRLAVSDEQARLFEWIVRGGDTDGLPAIVEGFVRAQAAATATESAALVREYDLPREAVRPEHLDSAEVWDALLERMPMTALMRNLATLTRVGVLAPGSARSGPSRNSATASACAARACTRSRCSSRCGPTRPAAASAAATRGRR